MKELWAANELLEDPAALERQFQADGYLFLRGVLDLDEVANLRRQIVDVLVDCGFATRVGDEAMWSGVDITPFGAHPVQLHGRHLWERFVQRPKIAAAIARVFGEPAYFLPMGQYQVAWPGKAGMGKKIHQDGYANPGIDFRTFWIPLMDIPEDVGGVAVVPRAHQRGPIKTSPPRNPYLSEDLFPQECWYRADYRAGDLLVFHGFTPHNGIPNRTQRLRLSVDLRAQAMSARRPHIGFVRGVVDDRIVLDQEGGERVQLTISPSTLVRTDEGARSAPLEDFIGRRVVVAAEGGEAVLLRWASSALETA